MPTVKFENKSARILHIGLGGSVLTVPPEEGGITATMDDAEHERLQKALETPAVKEWIDAGELIVTHDAEPPSDDDTAAKPSRPEDDAAKPPRGPEDDAADKSPRSPERKAKHGFFGGDKDRKGEP